MARREPDGGVRVVIAGGGTGGHWTPALALGNELARRGVGVTLVGGDRGQDRRVYAESGLPFRILAAPRLERNRWWRNVVLPARLAGAIRSARRILGELDPAVVVGVGGYASVPPVLAAAISRRPIVLQEQNSRPGVATRFLARWADLACVQFQGAAEVLRSRTRVEVTGSPIPFGEPLPPPFADRLDEGMPTIGVFGGSQGARALNEAVLGLLAETPEPPYNLVWQTGSADHPRISEAGTWPDRIVVEPYFSPTSAVYPHLDAIVCRAGAMTLAEVTARGIPAILVPYPHAADDHQTANARDLEALGAAIVLPEADLTSRRLGNLVTGLLGDPERRSAMARAARSAARPDAARVVADRVLELAEAS